MAEVRRVELVLKHDCSIITAYLHITGSGMPISAITRRATVGPLAAARRHADVGNNAVWYTVTEGQAFNENLVYMKNTKLARKDERVTFCTNTHWLYPRGVMRHQ